MGTTIQEGQSLGEFVIGSKLGEGGMGTVYTARQASLKRNVVVKVLPQHFAEDAKFVARFHQEATSVATFSHPGIVQVYSAGESGGVYYIAMELVEGESLHARIAREGRIEPRQALAIAVDVAQALRYAWDKARMIHRDIKPSNILLATDGRVKVVDFGMVKCLDNEEQMTATGMVLGTPHYMSPEQASGRKDTDFHTDIYSLGCTLYQMLSGHLPYEGREGMGVVLAQVNDQPPDIRNVMPDCPSAVVALLNKMLDKDPTQRQHSYAELIAELTAAHNRLWSAASPRRLRRLVYTAAGAVVIAAVAGMFLWPPWKHRAARRLERGKPFMTSTGMELVYIPPGNFLLGSTPEEREWAAASGCASSYSKFEGDLPQRAAIKQGFWLGRTEVTAGQWEQFVKATGYVTDKEKQGKAQHWKEPGFGFKLEKDHPVTWISWNDAVAFCEWQSEQELKAGRLPQGYQIRLPTEAEWEYACRAGAATKFWWGDTKEDSDGRLNWHGVEDGFEFVSPVDQYGERGRNKFGLADMLGNVFESCLDDFDPTGAHEECYQGNPVAHVYRGGSFNLDPGWNRCAFRYGKTPVESERDRGFRVACGVAGGGAAR